VTFNDHEGSTKSYAHTREHMVEVVQADFVPIRDEITTEYAEGALQSVMLHDGSWVKLRKIAADYDPTDRDKAYAHIRMHQKKGEVVTGLLYLSADSKDVHDQNETIDTPLFNLTHSELCPGNDALQKLMAQFR
jgi:2-oxoglutarate ferredoxin oxidoreductase subunit beta